MIVPQPRLLFWVAILVVPFATLAGMYEPATLVSVGILVCFILVALVDATRSFSSLDAITIKAAPIIRASRDRSANLELFLDNSSGKARRIRMGLSIAPPSAPSNSAARNSTISLTPELLDLTVPQTEFSKVDWPFVANDRGNYRLDKAYLEGTSPLGFWAFRRSFPLNSEIRVYPNLLNERRNLAALFLNRGAFGIHTQRQVGKGREFEKLREYVPGDGYDEVHWKATAKRGHPITKVFQLERTQEVYVIIDASRLSGRATGSENTTVLERYITAALVLGLAAERQGDLFGLLTFSDRIESFIRARNGKAHYHACRDRVYSLEPRAVTPDFDEMASFIRLRLRRRALLLVLTALDDPVLAESFTRNIDLLRRQHLVLVNMMKPPGVEPLFTNADVQTTDDLYERLRGHMQWQSLRELQKVLQRRGVDFSLLENERLTADLVTQYLNVKQRQLL